MHLSSGKAYLHLCLLVDGLVNPTELKNLYDWFTKHEVQKRKFSFAYFLNCDTFAQNLRAQMAELVDALDSKSGFSNGVQVRFLFWALNGTSHF